MSKEKIRKKLRKIISGVVIAGLVAASLFSVANGRFEKGVKGRLVAVSALYEEPAVEQHYERMHFQGTGTDAETSPASGGDAATPGNALTEQQMRDKAALEALKAANAESGTAASQAAVRSQKYQLNETVEIVTTETSLFPSLAYGAVGPVERADSSQGTYLGRFVLTGYCPCIICCGKTNGITASGTHAMPGHTIAADSRFAFGTKMIINGIVYTVEDRGGAIVGNHIDIFFQTHQEAVNFGKQVADVFLYTGSSTGQQ